ncbi:type 1 fimbrial protein [Serratia ureilytica]|uniref:fimbrial protein n=1 Tax=Serratia ureilytica TaxID=300181 RepID=UPI002DBC7434|nr:fimbrial protein [Serratia ureilytica]MEB5991834.1 type 1 fimbrial protein [Serratia ureilytica]
MTTSRLITAAQIAKTVSILVLLFSFSAKGDGDCRAIWHNPLRIEQSGITVPAGAQIGDLIGQGESNFSVKLLENNTGFSLGERGDLVMQPFSDLTATDLKYNGITVYETSWKGVGIAMSLNDKPGLIEFYGPRETPVGYILGANFKHYLIKTGDIQPGTMPLFAPFFFNYACLRASNARRLGHVYYPAVNIAVEGCRLNTPSKQVTLDKVNRRVFSGPGSVAGNTPFNIALECNANTKVDLEIRGETVNGHHQVLAITPSTEAATGIGLQILHNGVPFELGSVTNVLNETLIGINEIPLSAQYYQTEEKITPGEVNAVAHFTVSYR